MGERSSATATPPAASARPAPPLPAATLVLLRDGPAAGIEVLLLRRNQATRFAPGAFVFPGGRVDAVDSSPATVGVWDDLSPASAADRLGLPPEAVPPAIAYYAAALRETFEETGILPCVRSARSGEPVARPSRSEPRSSGEARPCPRRPALQPRVREAPAAREALLDGSASFPQVVRNLGLRLDGAALVYLAHWVTPAAAPRRYDTRFFAARAPAGSTAAPDERETTSACWLAPADALARHQDGTLPLVFPTRRTLEDFRPFASVDRLLAHFRHRPVSRIEPAVPGPGI